MWIKDRVGWSPWAHLHDDISLDIMRYQKIVLYCTYFLTKSIILCDKAHNRDGVIASGNLYAIFLNRAFSLDMPSIFIK